MALRIGGGGAFAQGMQMGRGIFNDAEANRRADAADKRAQDEADARAEDRARARQDRADSDYIAQGGLTGITPNMTVPDAYGVGPVAPASDVDIRYRGIPPMAGGTPVGATAPLPTAAAGAVPPTTGLPSQGVAGTTPVANALGAAAAGAVPPPVAPVPGAAPTGGMTPDQQTLGMGRIMARQGNVQGFFAAQDRAKEQKFQQGYDAYAKSLMEMSNDDFAKHVHELVTDNPKAPAKLKYDPKTMMLTVEHDDGSVQQMTRAQAMTHLMAAYEMGNGKVDKGLQTQLQMYNQRQQQANAEVGQENAATGAVAGQNLKVVSSNRQDQLAAAKIELERQQGNRMAAIASRAAAAQDRAQWVQAPNMVGPNGEPMMYDARKGPSSVTPMALPNGVRLIRDPASDIATRKEIQDRAKFYTDTGEKNTTGPNKGKPMTGSEALQRAMEDFPNAPSSRGVPTGGMTPDQFTAAKNILVDKRAGLPSPTGGRTSQNTTIPPMPPQMITSGGFQQVNPDYVDWMRNYGDVGTLEGGDTPASAITQRPLTPAEAAEARRTGYRPQ